MRYVTSGHSHGEQITIILEGIPANLEIDLDFINKELGRRQEGYGRGNRMKIERDQAKFIGGVLFKRTTGAPITIVIENKDYNNWKHTTAPFDHNPGVHKEIKTPRAGHADLVGALKYNQRDMRTIIERSSARETVARVAVGAICKQIANAIGIEVLSHVINLGGIKVNENEYTVEDLRGLNSCVRMASQTKTEKTVKLIDQTKLEGDTLGGTVEAIILNVPAGIGSYVSHDRKLDANISRHVLSIQSCKGVEFGDGFELANHKGSAVHDEIIYDDHLFKRKSNHYGGFEGGMTTGMPIIVRGVFKPIPTLMKPIDSVHIDTKETVSSLVERADVTAIPAASVILEHTVLIEVIKEILDQFTSDTMEQLIDSVKKYRNDLKEF